MVITEMSVACPLRRNSTFMRLLSLTILTVIFNLIVNRGLTCANSAAGTTNTRLTDAHQWLDIGRLLV